MFVIVMNKEYKVKAIRNFFIYINKIETINY